MSSGSRFGSMPSFLKFYEALNGRNPFPWQNRLAEQVAESGRWPAEVGVPTGLGKTACLDIAVWWLASQADRAPSERTAPTRIWWLVNRRLLVDSTADHADWISKALRDGEGDVLAAVGARLRSLSTASASSPLDIIRLRGGVAARRPRDPSHPAVLLSTIPMYGSRLLFRGYGTSRTMRPIDAALAGTDSLLLVDEAHLARHLTGLISALADCTQRSEPILGGERSRPQVVSLTATGDASDGDRFDLDEDDEANAIVRQRLDAATPVTIEVQTGKSEGRLAEAAARLLSDAGRASSCLVFANTPQTARAVLTLLRKRFRPEEADTILLTGRTREREAKRIRTGVLDPVDGIAANRDPKATRERHLVIVATQTLEVGADIDAEYMVTQACGVRALTQRLGRLNRLGHFGHARGVYVHTPAPKTAGAEEWPVYRSEPTTVLERLRMASEDATSDVDLSPRRVAAALGRPLDDPGRAPEVLDGLLWEWVKTTTPPSGEAPVEPYFSGISGADYSVSVVWRAHIPAKKRLWPRVFEREVVGVPIGELRDALRGTREVHRLKSDQLTVESVELENLRPGDTVLLPSDEGWLDEFGWNPEASSPVVDVSIAERGLPLDEEAIRRLRGVSLDEVVYTASGPVSLRRLLKKALGHVRDDEEIDKAQQREAAKHIREALRGSTPKGWDESEWDEAVSALDPEVVSVPEEVSRLRRTVPDSDQERGDASDELDETSLSPATIHLDRHGDAVGTLSGLIASRLGLDPPFVDVVRRAGRWHDLGKADARFQRWLDPGGGSLNGRPTRLLAKSHVPNSRWHATRIAAGWPRGGRHEALSARLVETWLDRRRDEYGSSLADLLLHLVLSHHGSGRPLTPPARDGATDNVASEIEGVAVEAPADLSIVDWDQPARFRRLNRQFGPWGLALLETILRQADHAVSSGATVPELGART